MVRVFYHVATLCVRGCRAHIQRLYSLPHLLPWLLVVILRVFAVHARVPETVPRWATRCSGSA